MPELEYVEQKLRPAWVKEVLDGIQLLWAGQSDLADRLAALAERLEKLEQKQENLNAILASVNNQIALRLPLTPANKTHYQLRKEKARRKVKR